jgi:hypothetical protein
MAKKEEREHVLFSKISDTILPVFVQYGRRIIREAMTLPETHLTLHRNYPNFTPTIEKYREVLMGDSRLIKCIRNLDQLDFFDKNKGKYLLLEHFMIENVILGGTIVASAFEYDRFGAPTKLLIPRK